MNRAKVVCTIGPASDKPEVIRGMLEAGMDVARLNFSHGDQAEHGRRMELLRRVADQMGCHLALMQDLQGPKIRTGLLAGGGKVELRAGKELTITTEEVPGTAERVSTTYAALPEDVKPGDRILLDDGLMELRVRAVAGREVRCEVVVGGLLGQHKGINLPGVQVSAPALTDKDQDDLAFGIAQGVDYVALSFVRRAADVVLAQQTIAEAGAEIPVVAKLEKPEAMAELEAIVETADAVMVARGDLGVETAPEEVPILQKRIIRTCREKRKPVITATEMLESMKDRVRPTRAEASDVANAIFDGTDAVMLSGETAVGQYPVESVAMMVKIASAAEDQMLEAKEHLWTEPAAPGAVLSVADAIARAAAEMAEDVGARLIIGFTHSGSTARLLSKCHPRMEIIAATPLPATARRCNLYWGVSPLLIEEAHSTDEMVANVDRHVQAAGLARRDEPTIIVAGTPVGVRGTTNLIKVHRVGQTAADGGA